MAEGDHLLGIGEEDRKLQLGHRVHDKSDGLGESEEKAVVGWDWNVFIE